MILIGQYDSSFVRRVGIALRLYGLPFEHRPWSVFGDADAIRPFNPLTRVPTMVLDDGEVLVETFSILDYLDSLIPAEERLLPSDQPHRRAAMRVAALAGGVADKAVSLFYELQLHQQRSEIWIERCGTQIVETLNLLERERSERTTPFWFGDTIGHADIAVAASVRHLTDSHPDLVPPQAIPAITAYAARLEALPIFQEISQPFIPPT